MGGKRCRREERGKWGRGIRGCFWQTGGGFVVKTGGGGSLGGLKEVFEFGVCVDWISGGYDILYFAGLER